MKNFFLTFLISISCLSSFADHLKGGWIYYEYLGVGSSSNTSKYKITVKQYLKCNLDNDGQADANVYLGIFDASTNQLLQTHTVPSSGYVLEDKNDFNCISNPSPVCYRVYEYSETIDLADNSGGYILAVQRCCRIAGIVNVPNSNTVGLTYTNTIPGIINGQSYRNNSSPVFAQKDTAIVCANSHFTFDFSATDADGDSLSYQFVTGLSGGDNSANGAQPSTPTLPPPPYIPNAVISYSAGYSGSSPMGSGVIINSFTGIISGTAPRTIGTYVIAVGVNEYRQGVLIGTTRKEIHIDVGNCQLTATQLQPTYSVCDSYSYLFQNELLTPAGSIYLWDFGDLASGINNVSSSPTPTHTFSDTGNYKIKLKITSAAGCQDSATAIAKVYPGFFPDFTSAGQCKNTQIQFADATITTYGVVNAWSWDFGDPSTTNDTSHLKNPTYSYNSVANYNVTLFVMSSKGCADTVIKTIAIKDKPDLSVTNDTLICINDTLQLNATGNGNVFWTPNYNINNQNNPAPLVSPKVPTIYYATLTDPFGCVGSDSVFVNVIPSVNIDAGADTSICQGDIIQLNSVSNALHYVWSPSSVLNNATIKNPLARPLSTTTFYVSGSVGKCKSVDSVKVKVTPYPTAIAKLDTAICFGNIIQLHASGGSSYVWSPSFFLNNPKIPNPIANPNSSIRYIVTVTDTLGCPKPSYDTVSIQVQRIYANAGPRDTVVVLNQPLQLNATGGQFYLWSPSTGLSATDISNPVATVNQNTDYVVRVSNASGCFATDTISVRLYYVSPGLYVPNAFTPNGDGVNDVFVPVALGMKQINYFRIYNRWGELIFSTSNLNTGWDGTFKGRQQDAAVYVWTIEGIDYTGKKISQKGVVTLIR